MPAPAATAVVTLSSGAPVYPSPPATTPSTPREYLSSAGPGPAHRAATSSWVSRCTDGVPTGSTPMSTTVSTPTAASVAGRRCTGLAVPKVTVSSANTVEAEETSPAGSAPLGRSTATTIESSGTARTTASAAGARPGRPPMPRIPSSTTSASCTSSTARGSARAPREATTSTPAAVTASSPAGCGCSETVTTAAATPSSASAATAYRASPPLSPPPTRATTRRPPRSLRRTLTTEASPRAARSIRVPSGSSRIAAPSAARTLLTSYASITAPPSTLGDDDGRRDAGVVGQGHVQLVHPQVVGAGLHGAAHLQVRAAIRAAQHRGIGPVQADRRPEGLGQGLLGREPGRQGVQPQVALLLREQPLTQPRRALQGLPEPCDVDDVDAHSDDHGARLALLDRDRLGQVARLVDVQALGGRQLEGEDLQRHDRQQRRQQRRRRGDPDDLVGEGDDVLVTLLGDHERAGAAGADLLDVGHHLAVQAVLAAGRGDDDEDRLARLDQCDRPVLELAGGEPLGVDVGQLLELERTLHRHREADVAAEEQHRAGGGVPPRQRVDIRGVVEHGGDVGRHLLQLADHRGDLVAVHGPADLGQVEPQQVAGDELRQEALGRGDPDL